MLTRNPFWSKMEVATDGDAAASYRGIVLKCLWYWGLCLAGVAAYFLVPVETIPIPVLIGSVVIALVCPFITYWMPSTSAVAGSLYSVVQGFLLALVSVVYAKSYTAIVLLAFGITALVFFTVLFLYANGIVKVNRKFRGVILAIFLASVAGSAIVYMSSFFTDTLTNIFVGDGTVALLVTVASLVITVLNLVYEFDFATRMVTEGIHKRFEWTAAYGLFMTVVMMFLRTIELLAKIIPKKQ